MTKKFHCDFCHAPDPVYTFPVGDFPMPHGAGTSTGGWAACVVCAPLVEAGDRDAILARASIDAGDPKTDPALAVMIGTDDNAAKKFLTASLVELHRRFWAEYEKLPDKRAQLLRHNLPDDGIAECARMLGWTDAEVRELLDRADQWALMRARGEAPPPAAKAESQRLGLLLDALTRIEGQMTAKRRALVTELHAVFLDHYAGMIKLPDGFTPHTFTGLIAAFIGRVPDMARELAMLANPATTATELGPGVETIQRLEKDRLILFAERDVTGDPAIFIAAQHAFTNPDDLAAADRLVGYFDNTGEFDAATGEMSTEKFHDIKAGDAPVGVMGRVQHPNEWTAKHGVKPGDPVFKLTESTFAAWTKLYPLAVRTLAEECKVSRRIVEQQLQRWVDDKVIRFVDVPGEKAGDTDIAALRVKDWPAATSQSDRALRTAFIQKFELSNRYKFSGKAFMSETGETPGAIIFPTTPVPGLADPPPDAPGAHTYARAIVMQYRALADLSALSARAKAAGKTHVAGMSIPVAFSNDIAMLKKAETFCWFPDPTHAVQATAATMPDSVRMERNLTMGTTGWWYFVDPLPVSTTTQHSAIIALLWSWSVMSTTGQPGVAFSAYVLDTIAGVTCPIPTTKCVWPEGMTLAQAMKFLRAGYRENYKDPDSTLHKYMVGEDESLIAMEELLRFFAAGSLWVQQKKLVTTRGHVERHERKRIEREHKLDKPLPDIQIIQLRRVDRQRIAEEGEHKTVDWKVRWIVNWHWRNQYYPSTGVYKPVLIDSYPKGPSDKPLKVPTHRVYTVNR